MYLDQAISASNVTRGAMVVALVALWWMWQHTAGPMTADVVMWTLSLLVWSLLGALRGSRWSSSAEMGWWAATCIVHFAEAGMGTMFIVFDKETWLWPWVATHAACLFAAVAMTRIWHRGPVQAPSTLIPI